MAMFRRHDMLQISDTGREHALTAAARYNQSIKETLLYRVIFPNTPAIVKAQEHPHSNFLEVGFSSHLLNDGVRIRVRSEIPIADIMDIITPFDLIVCASDCKHDRIRNSLEEIAHVAVAHGLDAGVYGSCALELLTGMPYILPTSDIDIIVKCRYTDADISGFYDAAMQISQRYGTYFDIEILCHDGSGVKLAELLYGTKTVMCKGLCGVELRLKKDIALVEHNPMFAGVQVPSEFL